MTTKDILIKKINFKSLDFSVATIKTKVGDIVVEGRPVEPVTAFPAGKRVQIIDANLDDKWIVTFDAKVGTDDTWKNVRSAPIENPLAMLVEMMKINSSEISAGIFFIDDVPRLERAIEIRILAEEHEKNAAMLKKEGAKITHISLYVGGDTYALTEAAMKKCFEHYREFVTEDTIIYKRGAMSDSNCKLAASILNTKLAL